MQDFEDFRVTLLRQIRHAEGGRRRGGVNKRFRDFPAHFHRSIRGGS